MILYNIYEVIMFNDKDITLFKDNIDVIEKKILNRRNTVLEPTIDRLKEMEKIVFDFVKKNKRKIYGGYAANMLIVQKNKNAGFYDLDSELADIDFYSPEPIEDAMRLANIFQEKGFPNVIAQEAFHGGTYKVRADFTDVADISYVPKNIYHRMPFIEIKGVNYVAPSFIMIDMFRMITDPLASGLNRWRKTVPRIHLIQKYYPFNKAKSRLPTKKHKSKNIPKEILDDIFKFAETKKSLILFGDYAYNCLLHDSGVLKNNQMSNIFEPINITEYHMISTNYREDAKEIYDALKTKYEDITIIEYYQFMDILGTNCTIRYKDQDIVSIFYYNRKCVPIKTINSRTFSKNSMSIDKSSTVQIAGFDYNFLLNMILTFRHRVNKNNEAYSYQNIMTSHLIALRSYFLKGNKTMLDDTLFEQFIVDCVGETYDTMRETFITRQKRYEQKKAPLWRYKPENGIKDPESIFRFPNASGNFIRNAKNLKIVDVSAIVPVEQTRDEPEDIPDNIDEDEVSENSTEN